MPDPLFQTLFNETDTMTWQPTDVLRDRARRRARRTRVTAMVATVLVVGVVYGGVAAAQRDRTVFPQPATSSSAQVTDSPSSPPPPSPSAAVSPPSAAEGTAVVDALFLQPGDLEPGYRVVSGESGSGDWTFEFSMSMLNCTRKDAPTPPIERRERLLNRSRAELLAQYVARYHPGEAAQYLHQVQAGVEACEPTAGKSIKVGARGFAGQDSLLIEVNYGEGFTTKHILVRQGDLLIEFFTKPERTGTAAKALATKAAQRLCGGTPVC